VYNSALVEDIGMLLLELASAQTNKLGQAQYAQPALQDSFITQPLIHVNASMELIGMD